MLLHVGTDAFLEIQRQLEDKYAKRQKKLDEDGKLKQKSTQMFFVETVTAE